MYLGDGAVDQVVRQYGMERVGYILANTLHHKSYDGRFSRGNKEWAEQVSTPEHNADRMTFRTDWVVDSHPAILDGFVTMFREELEAQKEQEHPFVKQFYVVENLQAAPLKIERFGNLDDAMSQYQALSSHYMKALGVEKNPDPLPGSLDILQCRNGIDTIYQIDNSEKNREYRCRSYEYQIQHGFMITADNYGTGYSGTASRGMGAEAIRKKMESINPDKFKIRKFGVSDVIGLTAAGKTSFFYVDKDRLVRFNGFFPKPQSGTYLILDEGGYQVAGQKGTWLVSDEVEVDGQRFVQMRSEQTKNPPPSIILHESGAFVTQTALGFDGEATRKMSAFLQGPKPELLHHQKFFENGTAERAKESGTEQNYNMIDGCVNNVPKKPRRIGGRWSVLDRLHIKQAERRQKDNAPQQEQERSRKS